MPLPAGSGDFLRTIRDHPHDQNLRGIFADWLEEQGPENCQQAIGWRNPTDCDIQRRSIVPGASYGAGDGYGYGYCDGYGAGAGDGYCAGDGDGAGDGYCAGDGDGYGRKNPKHKIKGLELVATIGKNQYLICPDAWIFVGFVAEQTGPDEYRLENASLYCRTGGVPWDEQINGKKRDQATFRPWGEVTVKCFIAKDWTGNLPHPNQK